MPVNSRRTSVFAAGTTGATCIRQYGIEPPLPAVTRAFNVVLLAVLTVLLVGSLLSLTDVLLHRSDYVFGTEVVGRFHRSVGLYLGTLLLETVVLSVALMVSHRTRNLAWSMLIRAGVILVYLGLMAVAIGTG